MKAEVFNAEGKKAKEIQREFDEGKWDSVFPEEAKKS